MGKAWGVRRQGGVTGLVLSWSDACCRHLEDRMFTWEPHLSFRLQDWQREDKGVTKHKCLQVHSFPHPPLFKIVWIVPK